MLDFNNTESVHEFAVALGTAAIVVVASELDDQPDTQHEFQPPIVDYLGLAPTLAATYNPSTTAQGQPLGPECQLTHVLIAEVIVESFREPRTATFDAPVAQRLLIRGVQGPRSNQPQVIEP